MSSPLVSILLPVYNTERYIAAALESILTQTYEKLEIIIIDDGSTDNTLQIVESFKDSRIQLHRNVENLRLIQTLNKGITLAKGDYIARMDADDLAKPERIEKQVAFLESHKEVGVCGSWVEIFGAVTSKIWQYEEANHAIQMRMLFSSPFAHPSVMIRKSVIDAHEFRYNEKYLHAEDYFFWHELSKVTKFANIQEVLLKYRVHDDQVGISNSQIQTSNTNEIVKLILADHGINTSDADIAIHNQLSGKQAITSRNEFLSMTQWASTLPNRIKTSKQSIQVLKVMLAKAMFHRFEENQKKLNLGIKSFFNNSLWPHYLRPGLLKLLVMSVFR